MKLETSEWERSEGISLALLTARDIETLMQYSQETHYFEVYFNHHSLHLVAKQHVGQCVVNLPDYGSVILMVHPKVPVEKLMEWWCWSESLIQPLQTTLPLRAVIDLLDQLAYWLGELVLNQARLGLLAAYREETEALTSPKGQMLIRPTVIGFLRGQTSIHCAYSDLTQNTPDNQVLLWTLDSLRRAGLTHPQARHQVHSAWRILQGIASLTPYTASQCFNWSYNRLNQHYKLMHQLCGMILSRLSVSETTGLQASATFMLPMNMIFERAVAKGLQHLLAGRFHVIAQEPHTFSSRPPVHTRMDLVIRDLHTNKALAVLDTKYKQGEVPPNSDVYQVVSYATAINSPQAVLIYPTRLNTPLNTFVGPVHTWSIGVSMNQSVSDALLPLSCSFHASEVLTKLA